MSDLEEKQFKFTDKHFQELRQLAYDRSRINLTEAKRELMYSRLARRIRKLKLANFDEYVAYLKANPEDEMLHFMNALTTNLTSFFREVHHFEYMATDVIPEVIKRNSESRRMRIWSAGCSTGQEPYSIAITLKEHFPNLKNWDVKILATDIDTNVLNTGKEGVYPLDTIEKIENPNYKKWFKEGKDENEGKVMVHPSLKELIQFNQLNLFDPWPMKGQFDLVFCRNVVIYFDKDTQRMLFSQFAEKVKKEYWLFVGHSENLYKVSNQFTLIGKSMYVRRDRNDPV